MKDFKGLYCDACGVLIKTDDTSSEDGDPCDNCREEGLAFVRVIPVKSMAEKLGRTYRKGYKAGYYDHSWGLPLNPIIQGKET